MLKINKTIVVVVFVTGCFVVFSPESSSSSSAIVFWMADDIIFSPCLPEKCRAVFTFIHVLYLLHEFFAHNRLFSVPHMLLTLEFINVGLLQFIFGEKQKACDLPRRDGFCPLFHHLLLESDCQVPITCDSNGSIERMNRTVIESTAGGPLLSLTEVFEHLPNLWIVKIFSRLLVDTEFKASSL